MEKQPLLIQAKESPLTKREMQVLELLVNGFTNEQIAKILNIGSGTINNHRNSIMNKLEVHDVAALVKKAIAQNLVSLELNNLQHTEFASIDPVIFSRGQSKRNILTKRQQEILLLLVEGFTVEQIAISLKANIKTIDQHRENLMTRLEIYDLAGLVKYAIATGMISLD